MEQKKMNTILTSQELEKILEVIDDDDYPIVIEQNKAGEYVKVTRNGKPAKLSKRKHPYIYDRKRFVMNTR